MTCNRRVAQGTSDIMSVNLTQNAVQRVQVLSHSAGKLAVLAALLLCLVPMISCSGRKVPQSGKATGGVERKVERGPVSAVVKLDKAEITIADRVNLTIEVRARED